MIAHLFIAMSIAMLSSIALLIAGYGFLVAFLAYSGIGCVAMIVSAGLGAIVASSGRDPALHPA